MADTIPNILISNTDWSDVYTLTSISEKKDITICNRSSHFLVYQESAVAPDNDSTDGQLIGTLHTGGYKEVAADVKTKVWLKCLGSSLASVNVQEI